MSDAVLCRIRVKGHLARQWTDWFGGLEIDNQPEGEALLSGLLPDQAAVYGVLNQMRNLGLALVSVNCFDVTSSPRQASSEAAREVDQNVHEDSASS